MKLKDDPNQSAHLCMIAQSEDSVKPDEPGHEKIPGQKFAVIF